MNTYTAISKRLGWDADKKVSIPSIEDAKKWQTAVMVNQDETAFEKVFEAHRFAPTPDGGEDARAMEIIWETFREGSRFFQ